MSEEVLVGALLILKEGKKRVVDPKFGVIYPNHSQWVKGNST